MEPTLGPTETAKPGCNSRDGASNQPRTPTEINENCALLTLSCRTHHALFTQMHSRTERNKLTAIRGREQNPSGSPTVPNLSRPGNELNTHPFLARPAPAREQFCPCRAAVARARGWGGSQVTAAFVVTWFSAFTRKGRRSRRARGAGVSSARSGLSPVRPVGPGEPLAVSGAAGRMVRGSPEPAARRRE